MLDSDQVIELVRRARSGDEAAWNAIVEEYAKVVWSVVRRFRFTEQEALDAVQTTWLRLVEHLDAIKNPAGLPGWLGTTARRCCLERVRHSAREMTVDPYADSRMEDNLFAAPAPLPEDEVLRDADVASVRRALATLEERDQVLLTMLSSADRFSYRQIADRLGIPIGSVGPTRQRALGRLQAALAGIGVTEMAR